MSLWAIGFRPAMTARTCILSLSLLACFAGFGDAQSQIQPANRNATPQAKAILQWMAELCSREDKRVLSGQHFGRGAASYQEFIEALHEKTGKWVALAGADVGYSKSDKKTFPGYDMDELTNVLIRYWNSGGLITLSYHAPHPWTGSHSWDKTPRDLQELIMPGNAAHDAYMKDLDRVAAALMKLRDAGVVVIWRPFHECNGPWFWWGHREGRETGKDLIDLWRHQYRYFTDDKKLDNLLWAYSPSSNAHEKVSVMFYYPGDEYVDIVGADFYGDEVVLDGYEALTRLDKPFGLTEFGPHRDSVGTMDYDAFIKTVREEYPRTTFFLPWHTGWSIIENRNGDAMMDDPWIIDRGEIDCRAKNSVNTVIPDGFPDWIEATPESQGVDSAKLQKAVELLAGTVGSDGARELVIIRHGRMIYHGDDIDKRHGVWSATKSFTSTVLGLLIADGKCTLDTRVSQILPELNEHYPDVTLRHFATMTSGYRAVGDTTDGSYKHGPSDTPFTPSPQPLFTPPGSQFAYWDSAMNTLSLALTKIADESMEEYFTRRVAEPIGMKDWDWGDYATVDDKVVNGGSGNGGKHIFISAREMAKFGLLFLNKGRWDDRQVVPESWVVEATRVHVPTNTPWAHPESNIDGRGVYGFNWWRNGQKTNGQRKLPAAPKGMFWASGHNNNKCFVIPEWDMVIVRLGLDGKAKDEVWNGFLAKVAESLR